jgi:hypothetical protein
VDAGESAEFISLSPNNEAVCVLLRADRVLPVWVWVYMSAVSDVLAAFSPFSPSPWFSVFVSVVSRAEG